MFISEIQTNRYFHLQKQYFGLLTDMHLYLILCYKYKIMYIFVTAMRKIEVQKFVINHKKHKSPSNDLTHKKRNIVHLKVHNISGFWYDWCNFVTPKLHR